MFYTIKNVQYLYKDQYGKQVFQCEKSSNKELNDLKEKIKKYESINPIYENGSCLVIRFNDTKHLYKPRVFYDIIYFIHRVYNEKNKRTYINLHVCDMRQCNKKELTRISADEV